MGFFSNVESYFDNILDRLRSDVEVHRREETNREREDARLVEEANAVTGVAKVLSVDFKAKYNAVNHKTEKYGLVQRKIASPVLRRGGTFSIDFTLNREIDLKKEYVMRLFFNFGNTPNAHKGTQGILNVSGKVMLDKNHEDWDVRVEEKKGALLTLEVQIPTSAPVGVWMMAVELAPRHPTADATARQVLRLPDTIYILFNPWNKRDSTYMAEEEYRKEYVLNDVGKIWQGGFPARGRHWVFGQFDSIVLPACVTLMERSGLRPEARGDPVFVSRAISKMVNSNDGDGGVVEGNWSGKYEDGTPPTRWTGSIKILEEYVTRKKPVKYGQCWVFAGVTNTVCRALGLPARVVTNLYSAHDTDVSLTIDEYVDAKGSKIRTHRPNATNPTGLGDSIWNFHVWNDAWMDRPDLPKGYGGWQAIDATPQETSDGVYQCGPASHEAIRRGKMELKYDVAFVLAEVNADVVHWQEDPDAQDGFKKIFSNNNHVGRQLLTKRVGYLDDGGYSGEDYEDCTNVYKAPEGSKAERVTLQTAARRSRNARHAFRLPSVAEEDVSFSIMDISRIMIGDDFTVTIKAESLSEKVRSISYVLKAGSTYYTGAPALPITDASGDFVLQPKESKTLSLNVPYKKYYKRLVEHAMVKMVAHCRVEETSYAWVGDDCFEVTKPDVLVESLGNEVVGKPFTVRFSFTNPLPETLQECVLVMDGPGLTRPKTIPMKDVGPKAEMSYEQQIVPHKSGEFVLITTFNSTQLLNLTGSTKVIVKES